MLTEDPDHDAYLLEMEACYRGWIRGWTHEWTAVYFGVDRHFAGVVYHALNRRWPGMAKRRLTDPRERCSASLPVL
jgi:hypothetical protein